MTPADYIALRTAEGCTATAAAKELAAILLTNERSVWRYLSGDRTPSPRSRLLLHLWQHCPASRQHWPQQPAAAPATTGK